MVIHPHHETPTLFKRPDVLHDPLYVVCPVINAARFRNRWKLFADFRKHVAEAGAILYTVEVAFGDRDFVVTSPDNPRDIQLRSFHELWQKERAINIGTGHLPSDWKYVAWIDGDMHFLRYDWADETRHLLQHWPLIQMWSQLVYLNEHYEIVSRAQSFMGLKMLGDRSMGNPYYYLPKGPKWGAPGLAWAARRDAWTQLGGLPDYCILGAGDWYFALALFGEIDKARKAKDFTNPFYRKLKAYEARVLASKWEERSLQCNVGMMRGLTAHYWHGHRCDRQYATRGKILSRHGFDPDLDLKPDWANDGLWQLTDQNPEMRREIQAYFASRNEDTTS